MLRLLHSSILPDSIITGLLSLQSSSRLAPNTIHVHCTGVHLGTIFLRQKCSSVRIWLYFWQTLKSRPRFLATAAALNLSTVKSIIGNYSWSNFKHVSTYSWSVDLQKRKGSSEPTGMYTSVLLILIHSVIIQSYMSSHHCFHCAQLLSNSFDAVFCTIIHPLHMFPLNLSVDHIYITYLAVFPTYIWNSLSLSSTISCCNGTT